MHTTHKDIVFDILVKRYRGFAYSKDIVYDILAYQSYLWGSSSRVGDSWHVDSTARGLGLPKANSVWISKRYASKSSHPPGEIFWRVTSIPPPLISISKGKYYKPDYKFVLSFFSLCFPNLFQIQSADFGLEPAKDSVTGLLVLGSAAS